MRNEKANENPFRNKTPSFCINDHELLKKHVCHRLKISLTCCTCWSSVWWWTSASITGSLIMTTASVSTWIFVCFLHFAWWYIINLCLTYFQLSENVQNAVSCFVFGWLRYAKARNFNEYICFLRSLWATIAWKQTNFFFFQTELNYLLLLFCLKKTFGPT